MSDVKPPSLSRGELEAERSTVTPPEKKSEPYTPGVFVGLWCVAAIWEIASGINWASCYPPGIPLMIVGLGIAGPIGFGLFAIGYAAWTRTSPVDLLIDLIRPVVTGALEFSRKAPRTTVIAPIILLALFWTIHGRYRVYYFQGSDGAEYVRSYDTLTSQSAVKLMETGCDDPDQ